MYCEFQIFSVARIKVIKSQPKPKKLKIWDFVPGSKHQNSDQGVLRKYISKTAKLIWAEILYAPPPLCAPWRTYKYLDP